MDRQQVVDALLTVHREIQDDLGEDGAGISAATTPLTDLAGFDSKLIPTALRMVAREIGWSPPTGTRFRNLYVDRDGQTKLNIGQIANLFCQTYGEERAA